MMQFTSISSFVPYVLCILALIILLPISETHNDTLDTRSDIYNESTYSIEKLCEKYVKSLTHTQRERPTITTTYVALLIAALLFSGILYCLCNTNCVAVIRRFMRNLFNICLNIYWLMRLPTIIIRNNPLHLFRAPPIERAVPRNYQVHYRDIIDLDALPGPPENEHMEC